MWPQALQSIPQQIGSIWRAMNRTRRLTVVAAIIAMVGGLTAAAVWLATPRYEPVFTGLQEEDLRAVLVALRQRGVDFQVNDAEGAVLVPQTQVHRVRLDLAMDGLPKNGVVGFELLKETNLGLTDFERRLRYYWALQGELVRTIRSLDGVMDARVHIVIPERSLFVSEQRPATASVLLSLMPGVTPSRSQIRGIVHLVANSVEGLTPDHVTVVDSRGQVLSDALGGDPAAGVSSNAVVEQLQLKRNYEKELERSLQATLEQIWGAGRVVTRVTADLSFDSQEERHEIFSPVVNGRSGIIRSEQRTEESFAGQGQAPGGVPGVTSNVPGYVAEAVPAGGPSEMQRLETVTNYEINKVERRVVMAPGRVQRLSIAVWIDGALDPGQRQRTEELVATAMGLQSQRGDQVSVESIRFAAGAPQALEAQLLAAQARRAPAVQGVAWWILAVGLALLAAWWVRRRMAAARRRPVEVTLQALTPQQAEEAAPSPAELERRRLREEVERLAREQPEAFGQLLRSWMLEEP